MNKAYSRINNGNGWQNFPSMDTPLNKENLDKGDIALNEIDNRVITLDTTKATKTEVSMLFKEVAFNEQTGIITFTRKNGATVTIDTPMEKIQTGIYYNPDTEKLVLPLIDGTSMEVDLSRLMQFDEFVDSDTIAFSVKSNGIVTAIVKEGSIQEKHLQPNYLADIKVEVAKAGLSATNAENYAKQAQSYAVGTGNVRPNEANDNAKKYYEQSKEIYDNFNSAGDVTGVKGNAETSYRKGNVNLTADNIGAISVKQLTNENLNDIKTPNLYYGAGSNSVESKPSGIDSFGLIVLKMAGTWFTQILYAGNGKRYTRRFNGSTSTWTTWTEEAQDDSSRPVSIAQMAELNKKLSLSGGIMTGRLSMEQNTGFSFLKNYGQDNQRYRMYVSSSGTMHFAYYNSELTKEVDILTCFGSEDSTGNVNCDSIFYGRIGTKNVGNTKHPIYLDAGNPTACQFESSTHAANVYMNTDSGNMYYSTASSRRFKNSILPLTEESISAEKLYDIDVVQYKYNTNYVSDPTDSRYDTLVPGLIAEDVYDKYPIAADYHINDDGEKVVDDWNFRYIIPGMLKLIQDQKKKIDVIPDMLKLIQDQQKEIDELKKKLPSIL